MAAFKGTLTSHSWKADKELKSRQPISLLGTSFYPKDKALTGKEGMQILGRGYLKR